MDGCVRTFQLPPNTGCARLSHDGNTLAVNTPMGSITLLNAHTNEKIETLDVDTEYVHGIVFSPDARWIAILCTENVVRVRAHDSVSISGYRLRAGSSVQRVGIVKLWDRKNRSFIKLPERVLDNRKCILTFSPCSQLLAVGIKNWMHVWCAVNDWSTPPIMSIGSGNNIQDMSFSCDSRTLAWLSWEAKLWRLPQNNGDDRHQNTPILSDARIECLAFSPTDPALLAHGGTDGSLCLTSNGVQRKLYGHKDQVITLSFSSCGQLLASGSQYASVRLWDVATGVCTRVLPGQMDLASKIMFLPNNKQIAIYVNNSDLRLWTLSKWTERTHHLFNPEFRRRIVWALCARARLAKAKQNMPYEIWRMIFEQLVI